MSIGTDHLNLTQADADLLDQFVDVGFELDQLDGLSEEQTQRANALLAMLGLLHAYPVEDASETLIDATLARINQHESQQASRMRISATDLEPTRNGFRIRLPDLISVAAVILIASSVMIMVYQNSRARVMSDRCASNMAMVGYGLAHYAMDHNGQMPTTAVASLGSLFDNVIPMRTDPRALVEGGYCNDHQLHCPSCKANIGGYSYQTQSAAVWSAIQKQGRLLVVLSDQNPILERLLAGQQFDPLTPSPNHGSLGRNQLRSDGSTIHMMVPPVFRGDLIWVLDGEKQGIDIFLTH